MIYRYITFFTKQGLLFARQSPFLPDQSKDVSPYMRRLVTFGPVTPAHLMRRRNGCCPWRRTVDLAPSLAKESIASYGWLYLFMSSRGVRSKVDKETNAHQTPPPLLFASHTRSAFNLGCLDRWSSEERVIAKGVDDESLRFRKISEKKNWKTGREQDGSRRQRLPNYKVCIWFESAPKPAPNTKTQAAKRPCCALPLLYVLCSAPALDATWL